MCALLCGCHSCVHRGPHPRRPGDEVEATPRRPLRSQPCSPGPAVEDARAHGSDGKGRRGQPTASEDSALLNRGDERQQRGTATGRCPPSLHPARRSSKSKFNKNISKPRKTQTIPQHTAAPRGNAKGSPSGRRRGAPRTHGDAGGNRYV